MVFPADELGVVVPLRVRRQAMMHGKKAFAASDEIQQIGFGLGRDLWPHIVGHEQIILLRALRLEPWVRFRMSDMLHLNARVRLKHRQKLVRFIIVSSGDQQHAEGRIGSLKAGCQQSRRGNQ